jgi:hypothetical protein
LRFEGARQVAGVQREGVRSVFQSYFFAFSEDFVAAKSFISGR